MPSVTGSRPASSCSRPRGRSGSGRPTASKGRASSSARSSWSRRSAIRASFSSSPTSTPRGRAQRSGWRRPPAGGTSNASGPCATRSPRCPRDAPDALRAVLYELLVLLNRAYIAQHGEPRPRPSSSLVERFERDVNESFRHRHRVADFAARLGVTPGHLNAVCRDHVRQTAGACIRARIVLEAKRLLLFTGAPAAEIAYGLGFDDPSYFTRFFRRESGATPAAFRATRGRAASPRVHLGTLRAR